MAANVLRSAFLSFEARTNFLPNCHLSHLPLLINDKGRWLVERKIKHPAFKKKLHQEFREAAGAVETITKNDARPWCATANYMFRCKKNLKKAARRKTTNDGVTRSPGIQDMQI
jgi:hypothetical protein